MAAYKIPKERETRRQQLYEQGLSDYEIAEVEGVSATAIFQWRKARGFASNNKKVNLKKLAKECMDCARADGDANKCKLIKEPMWFWLRKRTCPFWTDDRDWEKKSEEALKEYRRWKGVEVDDAQ